MKVWCRSQTTGSKRDWRIVDGIVNQVAWSSGWEGTLGVITYVWCKVNRTGEVELEIDRGEECTTSKSKDR